MKGEGYLKDQFRNRILGCSTNKTFILQESVKSLELL